MANTRFMLAAVLIAGHSQSVFCRSIGVDDPQIDSILANVYQVSLVNGKRRLLRLGKNDDDVSDNKWWTSGDGRKCENNIARMNKHDAAVAIEGSDYIVAFLECPAARDSSTANLVALFNKNNTRSALCTAYIDLSRDEGRYYWGGITYVGAYKKTKGKGFYLVSTMEGADAEDSWKSIDVFSFTTACDLKLLKRAYAYQYHSIDNPKDCAGEKMDYNMGDNDTITIEREKISCQSGKETGGRKSSVKLSLLQKRRKQKTDTGKTGNRHQAVSGRPDKKAN